MRFGAAAATLLLLLCAWLPGATVDRIAAAVDDIAIPESELARAAKLSGLQPRPDESEASFRRRVLDLLVDQYLQYQDALRFGPTPPDAAEISEGLEVIRERLRKEGRDPDAEFAAAGWTRAELLASVERQLVVQRYLRERFAPVALADEESARAEYEQRFVPETRAAGQPVPPFDQVAEQMRERAEQRIFEEEINRWTRELRDRARIMILTIPELPGGRTPIVIATAGAATTPTPTPTPTPAGP
ncbi:MAG TPA: hypothetical protein VIE39_08580 [Thermoanaerobaculia bacterium]|jgi:hypothetical protein